MNSPQKLPKVIKKKKIDLKKFVSLAKKVRESFEQENEYLKKKVRRDENNNPAGFLPNI